MKKIIALILAVAMLATMAIVFTSCSKGEMTYKIGVQTATTAQYFVDGDADWGFDGFPVTTVGYKNGSLAVQDLLNGNVDYVIIDSAPAACITEAINKMQ